MYSEPRRESHTPSGPSTTMSPPQDYVRMPSGQSLNYISTSDSRHQNYRLHQSSHEVSHNDLVHSPLHNNMGSRQLDFSPRQHSAGIILEPSGMPRVMGQKYNAPLQPSAILATKQATSEGFEPPSKRVKTEEHGSTGQSTGDVSDQDTEDEDMYEAEDRAGSGTPDPQKRKYSRKSSSRPPIQRNRGSIRVNPEDLEDQLPAYVDGVRVNKEWGLTKAGKARQRLPQACIACRKKKIKCMYVIQFPNLLAPSKKKTDTEYPTVSLKAKLYVRNASSKIWFVNSNNRPPVGAKVILRHQKVRQVITGIWRITVHLKLHQLMPGRTLRCLVSPS